MLYLSQCVLNRLQLFLNPESMHLRKLNAYRVSGPELAKLYILVKCHDYLTLRCFCQTN